MAGWVFVLMVVIVIVIVVVVVVFVFFRHDPPQSLILFIALSQIT
jgi:hypothetical protein